MTLAAALRRVGLRAQRHVDSLPGKPDFVFMRVRVCVFCDGDFWHGRDVKKVKRLGLGHNGAYWLSKIMTNRRRDRAQTLKLRRLGWHVVRVWERDVLADPNRVAQLVKALLRNKA